MKLRVICKGSILMTIVFGVSLSVFALTDEELARQLDEKFKRGEVSEQIYRELRQKYVSAKSSEDKGQGEVVISELNDIKRWKVTCDNPATKAKLSVEKYDARWPGGCLKLKYEGNGVIHLKFADGRPFGGTPKLFRVWTRGECPANTSISLKGVFRSKDGQRKKIDLSHYFQPYWMVNTCDFRFKKQIAWGVEDSKTYEGLTGKEAVNGSYVLEGLEIKTRKESKGILFFARASLWGDDLVTTDRLFFPDKRKKYVVYGRNLINDSGFEQGQLSSWFGYGQAYIDDTEAHTGKQSLRMTKVNVQESRNVRAQKPSLPRVHMKGVKVKVSAWGKAKDVTGVKDSNYALDFCVWAYADGSRGNYRNIPFDVGTHNWKYYEFIVETDPNKELSNIHTFRVGLTFAGNHTGTVWFDDVNCTILSEGPEEKAVKPSLTPLVKNSLSIPARWKPQEVCGRTFYVPETSAGVLTGRELYIGPSTVVPLTTGFRLAMQEIEVYSGGKNIAGKANIKADVEFGNVMDVDRIKNGKKGERPCLSEPSAPVPLQGSFTLEFGAPQNIDKVVLHHGRKAEGKLGYIAESFVLQYRKKGKWLDIPGAKAEGNRNPVTSLKFAKIRTDAIRIVIQRQSDGNNKLLDETLEAFFGKNIPVHAGDPYRALHGGIHKSPGSDVTHLKRFNREMERIYGQGWFGYLENEWDNSIAGYLELVSKGIETSEGKTYKKTLPKTKKEAFQIFEELFSQIREKVGERRMAMSTWNYNHYDMQWGSSLSYTELTAPVGKYPIQLAFTRGAARQYQKPWSIYIAHYMGNWNALSYSEPGHGLAGYPGGYAYAHGPDAGSTVSLEKRLHYLTYLSGANMVYEEGAPLWSDLDADGRTELSPWGEAIGGWHSFTKRHPERGITYTPIAIMLDYLHGWRVDRVKSDYNSKTWGILPYKDEDFMVNGFMYTVWPLNAERLIDQPDFALCNANEEHPWGELFDVIVPNFPGNILSHKVLSDYRVLFAAGGFSVTDEFADQLKQYVKNGGTVVLNVSQVKGGLLDKDFLGAEIEKGTEISTAIKYLEEGKTTGSLAFDIQKVKVSGARVLAEDDSGHPLILANNYGKGVVILTTPPFLLDFEQNMLPLAGYLLSRLTKEVLPFQIKGDIEYIINRNEKGWVVGLINNKGVYKSCDMRNPGWYTKGCPQYFDGVYNPTVKDESKSSEVLIIFPGDIYSAKELTKDLPIPVNQIRGNSELQLVVPPGDVRVVQLITN